MRVLQKLRARKDGAVAAAVVAAGGAVVVGAAQLRRQTCLPIQMPLTEIILHSGSDAVARAAPPKPWQLHRKRPWPLLSKKSRRSALSGRRKLSVTRLSTPTVNNSPTAPKESSSLQTAASAPGAICGNLRQPLPARQRIIRSPLLNYG